MTRERYDPETVIRAIRAHRWMLAPAAKTLGYDRTTLYDYVARHNLQWVVDECREESLDWAENALWAQIEQGNLTAIIFFLKCLGKSIGYVERIPTRAEPTAGDEEPQEPTEVIVIGARTGGNGHHG
jgi:hypothetical protein